MQIVHVLAAAVVSMLIAGPQPDGRAIAAQDTAEPPVIPIGSGTASVVSLARGGPSSALWSC